MTDQAIDVSTLVAIDRPRAIELGRVEYRRLVDALRALSPTDWEQQTDCTEWAVRDLAGHVTGMMHSVTAMRRFIAEQARSNRRAKRDQIDSVDAMTALQVEGLADLSTEQLIDRMQELVEPACRGRKRPPPTFMRAVRFPEVVNGVTEKWNLEYLFGIIITRDTWLHRVADVARAVDQAPLLNAEHDGAIVADVVAEWARRHGKAVELTLTGPAGGAFRQATSGPQIELDAVEFCRILTGRASPTHDLLATQVPF